MLIRGTSQADALDGTDARDNIRGGRGNDTLSGGLGNDWLNGQAGSDVLNGGDGADTAIYDFSALTTAVFFRSALDPLAALSTQRDGLGGLDRLSGIESLMIMGGTVGDRLIGATETNVIEGGGGDDTLTGGGGRDTFVFDMATDEGSDQITDLQAGDRLQMRGLQITGIASGDGSTLGAGQVQVGSYDASLNVTRVFVGTDATAGADLVMTLVGRHEAGHFTFANAGGSGKLVYSPPPAAAEMFIGTAGADYLEGRGGADTLQGGAGNDTLDGGTANDYVHGQNGNDMVFGGDGDDYVYGGAGHDRLNGGSGADRLKGDAGNDLLTGGTGDDVMLGGAGADIFAVDDGSGADRIEFFPIADGDRIRITADINGSGMMTAADVLAAAHDHGSDCYVHLGGSHYIVLVGVQWADLSESSFQVL